MSRHLAPPTDYDLVRAARRKLKGKRLPSEPRGMIAVAESALPADVLRDIRYAQAVNTATAAIMRGNWDPHSIFKR